MAKEKNVVAAEVSVSYRGCKSYWHQAANRVESIVESFADGFISEDDLVNRQHAGIGRMKVTFSPDLNNSESFNWTLYDGDFVVAEGTVVII